MKMDISVRRSERGNVIFYIFIAIALLGALSFAVSQSNQGNVTALSNERARLLASELIDYSNAVAEAVGRLRLNGVAETELCFDAAEWPAGAMFDYNHAGCNDESHHVFSTKGGGVQFKQIASEILDQGMSYSTYWAYHAATVIKDIGTHGTSSSNSELIMLTYGVQDSICKQINDLLGVANAYDPIPTEDDFATDPFQGSFNYSNLWGDISPLIQGKKSACFHSGPGGSNIYYRVLLAR